MVGEVHHGCSHLGELHRVVVALHTAVEEGHRMVTVLEVHRKAKADHEVRRMERADLLVHHTETVGQVVHHMEIVVLEGRRTESAVLEGHHRAMEQEGVEERAAQKGEHHLRSMSLIHLLCQSGSVGYPSASQSL